MPAEILSTGARNRVPFEMMNTLQVYAEDDEPRAIKQSPILAQTLGSKGRSTENRFGTTATFKPRHRQAVQSHSVRQIEKTIR